MPEPFNLPYVQEGLIEILLLSVPAGLIGTWIVLRGLAFYSHAIGTASFPGLVLADGLGFPAALGAFGMAGVFTTLSALIARSRRAAADSVTALALVTCLAVGVILASDVFGSGANVDTLLFGSLLAIGPMDMALAGAAALLAVVATRLFSAHWLAKGFDEESAAGLKSNSAWFDVALFAVVALTVTATLSAVGALLVAALMVIPAATVRMFTRRVVTLQVGTVLLVAVQGIVGLWLSVETNAPPGATIAVVSGIVFAVGLVVRTVKRSRKLGLAAAAVGASLVIAGCGGGDGGDSGGETVRAVATTTQVADIVREVGGEQVEVTQIIQPNTDPHDYEPRPSDVAAFADAEIVFKSGGHLDEWAEQLIEDSGSSAMVVDLSKNLPVKLEGGAHEHEHEGEAGHSHEGEAGHSHEGEKGHSHEGEKSHSHEGEAGHSHEGEESHSHEGEAGHSHEGEETDPHWWHDPVNVGAATGEVEAALIEVDPAGEADFTANADAFRTEIDDLNRAIARCFDAIPAEQRKLVTDHDALGYFANRYDIEVVGAVTPALTTQAQPSAGDLAELERTIEEENVSAVFPETAYSPQLADAVARDTGATTEYSLYGDTLGPEDSPAATWVGMMQENANSMALGFTGGEQSCDFG
jgi:ABC-type Zn uptake system ZnuABC Zn-binding protein ZnuA/ABC-type Mn2+/Zn2+ transport system permease subunit